MSHLETLERELERFGLDLPPTSRLALANYCDEVARWNKKINLTGLSGQNLVRRLVVEPAWTALQFRWSGTLLDIGSGNGSPAIPFQIVNPFESCHLVEARAKRAAFLRHIIGSLKLQSIWIHRGRFEEVVGTLPKADWISLQAVALSDRVIQAMRQAVSPTTRIVWITSLDAKVPCAPLRILSVPVTGSRVFEFKLDLS